MVMMSEGEGETGDRLGENAKGGSTGGGGGREGGRLEGNCECSRGGQSLLKAL